LKIVYFTIPNLYLAVDTPLGLTIFEFHQRFWLRETGVPGLLRGIVCMILRLAILVQCHLVMDRQIDRHKARARTMAW